MKKGMFFLVGSALFLASCGSNTNNDAASNQAKIDSAVKAGEAAKEASIKSQNDSTIAAQAKAKADSEMIAKDAVAKDREHHGGGTARHEHASPANTATVAPTPTNPKDSRFNSTTQPQQQQDNTNKKADRFK